LNPAESHLPPNTRLLRSSWSEIVCFQIYIIIQIFPAIFAYLSIQYLILLDSAIHSPVFLTRAKLIHKTCHPM
jgi:hypothetical protein